MADYDSLTFGLAQDVTVNGTIHHGSPINVLKVSYNETAVMTPIEKVTVFLAGPQDDGIVLYRHYLNAIEVEFCGDENEKTITYDSQKDIFNIT